MTIDPHIFEDEVRRIARYRWPRAEYSGSAMVEGQERDGVFITDECIHLLECTTSRQKDKALFDLKKLHGLYNYYRKLHPQQAIKCWFITKDEPTADQRACRAEIKGAPPEIFNILSLSQFLSKLIESSEYLARRDAHKFGSAYDPKTGSTTNTPKYIDVGLRCSGKGEAITLNEAISTLLAGGKIVLLGEYGVGKSMTLREIYRALATKHRRGESSKFPVFVNLREHQGQHEPAEILERHARNIGFHQPSQLVRAWKAGYVILLLDGFDEVSSLGLQGAWRRLRDARNASMAGIRNLLRDSPQDCGIALAGREHFFDTDDERRRAIGQMDGWLELRLDEFTEKQIEKLVQQFGYRGEIPPWIPTRPLLLSTLFARGLSADASAALTVLTDPASGWDMLINEVCAREARIEQGISGDNIRTILESLATLARSRDSGLGPLRPEDIVAIFRQECGFLPADEALIVLQRLPGLGRDSTGGEDSRCFVDYEFADACRAGDLRRFALDPFNSPVGDKLSEAKIGIGLTGVAVACLALGKAGFNSGRLSAAIKASHKISKSGALPVDLLQVALMLNLPIEQNLIVSQILFDRFELVPGRSDMANVQFSDCYFGVLQIPPELTPVECPVFRTCLIQELEGRVSYRDMPNGHFLDCVIEAYETSTGGTSGTMDIKVPAGAQVLLSLLKKLFVQSLGGRKENALYRGLDEEHQGKVSSVLEIIKRHGLAKPSGRGGEPIWLPVRWNRSRAMAILDAPSTTPDPAMVEARKA